MAPFNMKLPTLTMHPCLPMQEHIYHLPKEREINRNALLDVAPDREDLIMSNKTIDELRQALKIRVTTINSHWLYHNRKRMDVKLRDNTTRISAYMRPQPAATTSEITEGDTHVVRRVSSTSSVRPFVGHNCFFGSRKSLSFEIWGTPNLSTIDQLISPRPLGPTHLLLIYTGLPTAGDPPGSPRRRNNAKLTFPTLLELPINDLLFLLNVPNLSLETQPNPSPLPRRLHKDLPRVLMRVPHLEAFPDLVIYLHTKNQAELFRRIIPEWIRDLMHPLPVLLVGSRQTIGSTPSEGRRFRRIPRQIFGMLASGSSSSTSLDTLGSSATTGTPSASELERTMDLISRDIGESAQVSTDPAQGDAVEALITTVALLDALRDNLEYIGYFEKSLWNELYLSREVLIRTLSCKAKLDKEEVD